MLCPYCQHEQDDSAVLCESCGMPLVKTEPTPEVENTIVAEPENAFAPPAKKKRLGLLIVAILAVLAAGVVACSFLFDWWGGNTPTVPVDNKPPVVNEPTNNLTMSLTLLAEQDGETLFDINATSKMDLAAFTMWMQAEVTTDELPFSMEMGMANFNDPENMIVAILADVDSRLPTYASMNIIHHTAESDSVVSSDMIAEILETDPADFDIEALIDKYDELAMLYAYEEEGVISIEGLEQAIRNLLTVLRDKDWLATTFGYSKTEGGELTVHSLNTDLAVIVEAFAKEIKPALGEQTAVALDTVLLNISELKSYTLTASLTARGTVPELMSVSLKTPDAVISMEATVTDINKTTVDIDTLKDAIIDANEGYTVCRECKIDPSVYQGYCELCYDAYHCDGCFAPVSPEETMCEDCFVPCSVCGELAGYDNNGEDYCFECYFERFCYNEDGHPVYMDGYCEDCYIPCEFCDSYADYQENGMLCCWSCYYDRFCYNDDGNPVYLDGYCEDCFVPCVECAVNYGYEEYDGLCSYCYYDKYCIVCGKDAYTDGYCEDCYTPCTVCGEGGGDEYYDGLCWECYFETVEWE